MNRSILLIYTGGTIGMKQDTETLALKPFNFNQITEEVPELKKFGYKIDTISFDPVIDSSDVVPSFWVRLVELINENYKKYDGFVVLHGTDTMSYTASVLSFMLEDLEKPVVLTGSQLPIGMLRTDGKENLISSIEIAAAADSNGRPMVPEVCVYFKTMLFRGNRTTKYNAENFRAFRSANYPILADVGIHIKYNPSVISYPNEWGKELKINTALDTNVAILKIFPGIQPYVLDAVLSVKGLRAVILETFGSGNAPTSDWFIERIKKAVNDGLIVMNVTQCHAGKVNMDAYATGIALKKEGVVGGFDITTESALAKLFYLLGKYSDIDDVKRELVSNLRGEISI
ncbi:MAG: type I asparaginase [Bacteroidales bacterium]|nr:type I asparaginase [Bacteroidales bacterium]